MRVLVAPSAFKGSLTPAEAADAIARGLAARGHEVDLCPIADGGDGTVDAAVASGFTRCRVTVAGPTGEPVASSYARRARDGDGRGDDAVVELADTCGLVRLPDGVLRPREATTTGLGEIVGAAIEHGAQRIVLGIGGSASTDGGAGLAQALGVVLRGADGAPLPPGIGGGRLPEVASVDLAGLRLPDDVVLEVACDVDNPLLGPYGAAAVYGPQKGADEADVAFLDDALAHWAHVVGAPARADEPGAGAAGGVGFGLMTLLRATVRPGFDLVAELLGFDDRLAAADLVVTGEGRLDTQTLHGKGPAGVAARARAAGVPVAAVAGRIDLTPEELAEAGIVTSVALADLEPDLARSQADAAALLEACAARLSP